MSAFNSPLIPDEPVKYRREPHYIADDAALALEHYYVPAHYQDYLSSLLVPHGMIVDRVEKLAYDISRDYEGHTVHMLVVLKGGATFFGDLSSAIRRFHDCKCCIIPIALIVSRLV